MIYIKIGKHKVDEVPILIYIGGIAHTLSDNELEEPNEVFELVEEYYSWAAENVDGWGLPPGEYIPPQSNGIWDTIKGWFK
jgi:hypothetical protein